MLRYYLLLVGSTALLASMLTTVGSPNASPVASGSAQRTIAIHPSDAAKFAEPENFQQASAGALTLKRQSDGHFYADARINGTSIRMLVDTGASTIALSRDDARRAGIGISIGMPTVVGRGASGDVKGEYVTLDRVSLGGESAEGVSAIVLDGGEKSLLGQSFLSKFESVEIKGDTMVLQ
jgi:aspartyl protease family protein